MGKIKDLSPYQRPREKALRNGIETLSNAELLAIIIQSGSKNKSALDISNDILSSLNGLENLKQKRVDELIKFYGISKITALKFRAFFELEKRIKEIDFDNKQDEKINDEYIAKKYCNILNDQTQECLIIIALNKKRNLISEKILFKGNEDELIFSSKEIFRYLLNENASCFYMIHNHLSGSALPSSLDIYSTNRIKKDSGKIGLKLIDHLIISEREYYSFRLDKVIKCSLN